MPGKFPCGATPNTSFFELLYCDVATEYCQMTLDVEGGACVAIPSGCVPKAQDYACLNDPCTIASVWADAGTGGVNLMCFPQR